MSVDSPGGEIGGKTENNVEILTPRLQTFSGDGSGGNITATVHEDKSVGICTEPGYMGL